MKRLIIISLIILSVINSGYSQHQYTWKKWGIKYETSEKLEKYKAESRSVYGRDNDNYAVDIEVISLKEKSAEYISNAERSAHDVAESMLIKNIKQGDSIPKVKKAFYVIGEDKDIDNSLYPVIIMVIIDEKQGVAFEINIDCYSKDVTKGIAIAKSFELIN